MRTAPAVIVGNHEGRPIKGGRSIVRTEYKLNSSLPKLALRVIYIGSRPRALVDT